MAEVEKSTRSGEATARFIEFVMMQAQNASLFLGLIPNPNTGKGGSEPRPGANVH